MSSTNCQVKSRQFWTPPWSYTVYNTVWWNILLLDPQSNIKQGFRLHSYLKHKWCTKKRQDDIQYTACDFNIDIYLFMEISIMYHNIRIALLTERISKIPFPRPSFKLKKGLTLTEVLSEWTFWGSKMEKVW